MSILSILDINIMADDYSALWRASAHEAVPYTEDYPECLHVLPEWIDGSIAQGRASCVTISVLFQDDSLGTLRVYDNGKGITNQRRLMSWSSSSATDIHHRYGHGSKKCLTKWHKDYDTANWHVRFRTCDRRNVSSSLFTFRGPFKGMDQQPEEDEKDEKTIMPSGTEWSIDFHPSILGIYRDPTKLHSIIKEIIRTRYSAAYLDHTEFIIDIQQGDQHLRESSKEAKWTTFEECLLNEIQYGNVEKLYDETEPFQNGTMRYALYCLKVDGKTKYNLKTEFPRYGNKNQKYTRVHISISGRTIEIAPLIKFHKDREVFHNSMNGRIGFVQFEPSIPQDFEQMPTPCTTKVSFYENCPYYKKFVERMKEINATIVQQKKSKEEPEPAPKKPNTSGKGPRLAIWYKYIGQEIHQHKCLCCKIATMSQSEFEVGHIVSRANGGDDKPDNKRPICKNCNRSMGTTNMKEYIIANEYYY